MHRDTEEALQGVGRRTLRLEDATRNGTPAPLRSSRQVGRRLPVRKIKATAVSVPGDLWRDDGEFDDFKSYLEHCRLLLLRYEDPPCSWECQPMEIVARGPDGVLYKSSPDLKIVRRSTAGASLITIEEVEDAQMLKKHKSRWKNKWIALREYCRERRWRFGIFTGHSRRDRAKVLLRNIRLIRWFGRDAAYSRCPEAIIDLLREQSLHTNRDCH